MTGSTTVLAPATGGEAGHARSSTVVVVVGLGSLISALSFSSIQVALPKIASEFGVDVSAASWVPLIQTVVMTGLLLPFGWLGDRIGHRQVFTIGLVVVALGTVVSALAPNLAALYAGRVIAMTGTAMWIAVGSAIVTNAVALERRGQAMGWQVSFTYVGLASGPTIGGIALAVWDWRGALWILVPPILAIAAASVALLPPDRPADRPGRFDFAGTLLLLFGFTASLLALTRGHDWGWFSPATVLCLIGGLALLGLFVRHSLRTPQPLLDLSLFRNRMCAASTVTAVLLYVGSWAPTFLTPFYLLDIRGLPPATAGLLMAAMPIGTMIVSPIIGVLADRIGSRGLTVFGMTLLAADLLSLSLLSLDSTLVDIALRLAVIGVANGIVMTPNNIALLTSVPAESRGTAAALIGTARNVGMAIGIAVAGTVFSVIVGDSADGIARLGGVQGAYLAITIFAALGIVVSAARGAAAGPAD